jgi:acyl carrier protein
MGIPLKLEAILALVLETVRDYRLAMKMDGEMIEPDTTLFGSGGALDSIGLVSVVIELEQRLSDLSGQDVTLMNDRAMSRSHNPFRTPRALAEYAYGQLSEGPAA